MVLPAQIFMAARNCDRELVYSYLDDPGPPRDAARDIIRDSLERYETRCPALASDEHWLACKTLILGVRAAGSWRAYARLPRLRVLRLRSLMLRGRARARRTRAGDAIVSRAFKLPNEMVWKVLAFWRVESEVTGEVI